MRDDTRFVVMQTLMQDARQLVTDIQNEHQHNPVDATRLQRINTHLIYALAASEWFTRRYPDEAS